MGSIGNVEWFVICIILLLYFLPAFIAFSRKSPNRIGIFILNFFLGWTGLGWIGSLIWAFVSKSQTTIIVNNNPPQNLENMNELKSNKNEKFENLHKLKNLLDSGAISREEFEKEKIKILES